MKGMPESIPFYSVETAMIARNGIGTWYLVPGRKLAA